MTGLLLLLSCGGGEDSAAPELGPEPEAALQADALVYVGEPVLLDGTLSVEAERYRWWPDGETDLGWSEEGSLEWIYAEPGRYQISLQVEDAWGRSDSARADLVVVHPPLETPPRAASTLVRGDDRLFALLTELDRVAVVQPSTGTLLEPLETCARPSSLGWGEGLLAVSCPSEDRVQVYSCAPDCVLSWETELERGARPFAALPGADALGVVEQGSGHLHLLDLESGESLERVSLGPDPRGLAWSEDRWLVSRYRSDPLHGSWWAVDRDGTVEAFELAYDPGPDSDTDARGLPSLLERLAVRPDGRSLVLGGLKANLQRGSWLDGQALTHDSTARSKLKHVSLVSEEGGLGAALEEPYFDNRDRISALAYSPQGELLFVAHAGAEVIDILDPWTLQRVGGFQSVEGWVTGLWHDGERLWVHAAFDEALRVFETLDLNDAGLPIDELDLLGELEPPGDSVWRLGREVFHRAADPRMSQDAYISCASCHPEGDHDGQVWDFSDRGEGLRSTPALYDRSPEQPIHWSANFDELQDFEHDIRGGFGGQGFLSEADWQASAETLGPAKAGLSEELDAMAHYVDSLRPQARAPAPAEEERLAAGEALFYDPALGCSDCHLSSWYSDSQWLSPGEPLLWDVGTLSESSGLRMGAELSGLDTPPLLGLFASAPYLHDGSASTLTELLTERNPEDQHGVTSQLSEGELEDLVAFLLSLE